MTFEERFRDTLYYLLAEVGASKQRVDNVMNKLKEAKKEFSGRQNKELIEENEQLKKGLNSKALKLVEKIQTSYDKEIVNKSIAFADFVVFKGTPRNQIRSKYEEFNKLKNQIEKCKSWEE